MKEIDFRAIIGAETGWGRAEGRACFNRLVEATDGEEAPCLMLSMAKVRRLDFSFCSETVVALAVRLRRRKGVCISDLTSEDLVENFDAAAGRSAQPLLCWKGATWSLLGQKPGPGLMVAFRLVMKSERAITAAKLATTGGWSVQNASNKLKQLWNDGYVLRWEEAAVTGGLEYSYQRIGR